MTMRASLRHRLEFFMLRILEYPFRVLPFRLALRTGAVLGTLCAWVLPVRKRVMRANIQRAFGSSIPKHRLRTLMRRCYRYSGISAVEFMRLRTRSDAQIKNQVLRIEGEHHYLQLGGTSGGFIALTGHLGNWEFMGAYFSAEGLRVSVIAKPIHNPFVNDYVNRIRQEKGYEVISTDEGMKKIVSRLKASGAVVFLADQDARKTGIFVEFFGSPASTHTGPALFMTRLRIPILPVFDIRVGLDKHVIIFHPPIYPPQEADKTEAIRLVTEQHVRILEDMVRQYPDQYFWYHRRWKTQPGRDSKS
jgi:KDO2-lipid IV(A) lauroyltransferase